MTQLQTLPITFYLVDSEGLISQSCDRLSQAYKCEESSQFPVQFNNRLLCK